MHRFFLGILLSIAVVTPAKAEYGWCTIQKDGSYDTYLSAVVDIGEGSNVHQEVLTRQFGRAFQSYVAQFETIVREPDCHSSKRLSDAEEGNRRYSMSVGEVIRTNWRGAWPAPGASSGPVAASGSHLTVSSPPAPAAPEWSEAQQQQQRQAAAELARNIAASAKARAESEAALTAFLDAMRKRGRAQ